MKLEKAVELCLGKITGQFETEGRWDLVTDNFDGSGPSVGIIQFCFGVGTLQGVMQKVNLSEFFHKSKALELNDLLNRSLEFQKDFVTRHWFNGKEWKDEVMKEGFKKMAKSEAFRRAQIEGVKDYVNIALELFKEGGFSTVRSFAVLFDIAIQNGGIGKAVLQEISDLIAQYELSECRCLDENEKLEIWIDVRVSKTNSRWMDDVRSRKYAILKGEGVVHGTRYSFVALNLDEKLETA